MNADSLLRPLALGPTTLPNRVCFLAHRTNFGRRGRLDPRHGAYYGRRAEGGCGLVMVGELSIHPNDFPWEGTIATYASEAVEDFKRLAGTLHAFDTPVFAQLGHHGFQSNGARTRRETWGPSPVADVVFGEVCKPMEPEDIDELIAAFARAATVVKAGGFDGIEIDMGPESLLRQFLSPLSNQRQDDYGGSLDNRLRLPLAVIAAVRQAVGSDMTVGVRLCVDERFWGALTPEETLPAAEHFEAGGRIDFITTAIATYYNLYLNSASMHTPMGHTMEAAEQVKTRVQLPVIAGDHIGFPQMAAEVVAGGQTDAVGCIRALICDPDLVTKLRVGELASIRPCLKDNQGCVGRINQSKSLGCTFNPKVGYEGAGPLSSAASSKKVMVVGAGPAGLEAARMAARRGHAVTVWEASDAIGGQVVWAQQGAGRERLQEIVRYYSACLEQFNVPVNTGVIVTPELIQSEHPDAVIVATGARPVQKPFPGDYGPPQVLNVIQVLGREVDPGQKVLLIDETGGHRTTATAELLADQGRKVDLITSDLFVGIELAPIGDLYLTRQRLLQKGVTFTTDVAVDAIRDGAVRAHNIYTHAPLVYAGYDTIVIDAAYAPQDELYRRAKGLDLVSELYRIGDCVAPRTIEMAIFEGSRIGESL